MLFKKKNLVRRYWGYPCTRLYPRSRPGGRASCSPRGRCTGRCRSGSCTCTDTCWPPSCTRPDLQGHQLYMAVYFWYLVKGNLSGTLLYNRVHYMSIFTRYQKNTAMFIWSGFIKQSVLGSIIYLGNVLRRSFLKSMQLDFASKRYSNTEQNIKQIK